MKSPIGIVSMGYGGIEINEDHINLITKRCEIKSKDGYQVKEEKNKVKQMENIHYMIRFLQDSMVLGVYVEPLQVKIFDEGMSEVMFLVDGQYYLNVNMTNDHRLIPVLFYTDDTGEIRMLKFSYEGDLLEWFFTEIKKDMIEIVSNHY